MKTSTTMMVMLAFLMLLPGCDALVDRFAFYPDTKTSLPAEKLPPGMAEIFLTTADHVRLQAYLAENPGGRRLLIFFHGNAGNLFHRLPDILSLRNCGVSVLAVSYRGYGKSGGAPSEEGIYADGAAALKYAVGERGYALKDIIVFGRSIGSTVAVNTARGKDMAGLILISPLTSANAYAKAKGLGFFSFLAGDAFDNLSKMADIRCPLLVVHGTADEVIPVSMGREIFSRARAEKKLVILEGAGHNNLAQVDPETYWGEIASFIRRTGR